MRSNPNILHFRAFTLMFAASVGAFTLVGCGDKSKDSSAGATTTSSSSPPETEIEVKAHGDGALSSDPAEIALRNRKTVGVVPGIVTFKNGDMIVRPLAGIKGDVACPGEDALLHDDADSFVYRKNGQTIHAVQAEVSKVEISEPSYVQADQATSFVVRQCITAEGPVLTEAKGYCVPIGVPDPDSRRLAVGTFVSPGIAQQVKAADC